MAGWGTASILDPSHQQDRARFAGAVSKATGLSFYTVWGWTQKEGGSYRNPLGVNYAGGRNPPQYPSVDVAAQETIKFLQGSNYAGVRAAAAKPFKDDKMGRLTEIATEALAIGSSPFGPWGKNLTAATAQQRRDYAQTVAKAGAALEEGVTSFDADAIKRAGGGDVFVSGPQGDVDRAKGAAKGALGGIDKIADIVGWPFANPWRTLEIVGGGVLLLVGIVLIAKQAGAPVPGVPSPLRRATDPVEAAFTQGEEQGLQSAARSAGRRSARAAYQAPSQNQGGPRGDGIPF